MKSKNTMPHMLSCEMKSIARHFKKAATHYQTGRGTLCSLDNDASIRTHTEDVSTVDCRYCLSQLALNRPTSDSRNQSNETRNTITNGKWLAAKNGNQYDIYSADSEAERTWTVASNLSKADAFYIIKAISYLQDNPIAIKKS